MQVQNEYTKRYVKVTLTRQEILDKLGFDTNDAFDVNLKNWGLNGVTFTLVENASDKYTEAPSKSESVTPVPAAPTTRSSVSRWLGRFTGGGSRT